MGHAILGVDVLLEACDVSGLILLHYLQAFILVQGQWEKWVPQVLKKDLLDPQLRVELRYPTYGLL